MDAEHLRLRSADEADAESLAPKAALYFIDAFVGHDLNERADVEAYAAEAFALDQVRADLADPACRFVVAENDQGIVGYAAVRVSSEPAVTGAAPVELWRIYVAPESRGRSVGSRLMDWCLESARRLGGDVLWLGVWEHNIAAHRFYERYGFERVGEHAFQLGSDTQIDSLFARPLSPPRPR